MSEKSARPDPLTPVTARDSAPGHGGWHVTPPATGPRGYPGGVRTDRLGLRLDPPLRLAVEEIAAADDCPVAEVVRAALAAYVAARQQRADRDADAVAARLPGLRGPVQDVEHGHPELRGAVARGVRSDARRRVGLPDA